MNKPIATCKRVRSFARSGYLKENDLLCSDAVGKADGRRTPLLSDRWRAAALIPTTDEFWRALAVTWLPLPTHPWHVPAVQAAPFHSSELYQPRRIRVTVTALFKSEKRMLPVLIQRSLWNSPHPQQQVEQLFPKHSFSGRANQCPDSKSAGGCIWVHNLGKGCPHPLPGASQPLLKHPEVLGQNQKCIYFTLAVPVSYLNSSTCTWQQ